MWGKEVAGWANATGPYLPMKNPSERVVFLGYAVLTLALYAGWRLRMTGAGVPAQQGDFRMAGTPAAEMLERAQAMAAGPALEAAQERRAKARGWR